MSAGRRIPQPCQGHEASLSARGGVGIGLARSQASSAYSSGPAPTRWPEQPLGPGRRSPTSDSGYASVVTPQPATRQCALSFLLVLAVVFAPAPDEAGGAGPLRGTEDSLGARILAPTVRQGIKATDPKLPGRHLQIVDQRSRQESIPLMLASVAAVLLFVSLTWFARRRSRARPRLVALRALVPRAPPTLRTT
jgi:hypothetical protein